MFEQIINNIHTNLTARLVFFFSKHNFCFTLGAASLKGRNVHDHHLAQTSSTSSRFNPSRRMWNKLPYNFKLKQFYNVAIIRMFKTMWFRSKLPTAKVSWTFQPRNVLLAKQLLLFSKLWITNCRRFLEFGCHVGGVAQSKFIRWTYLSGFCLLYSSLSRTWYLSFLFKHRQVFFSKVLDPETRKINQK